ncbi:MAG TPA: T9SS type A sorting domain-containing protein [Cyclobacteriaceae bacterium]|nr:T9SS type A sorting domain-containing protein [Cyclobacteriaceae bacterium]
MQKIKLYLVALGCAWAVVAEAQLAEFPLEKRPDSKKKSSARTQAVMPVSLPFWDDFSFTDQSHAVDSLWLFNEQVFVSSGQAINTPTLNVATFDGLDKDGIPYNPSPSGNLEFGYQDTLTSQPIKMTEVDLPFRNNVFLSFFYQGGGNGEPPDPNDFLRLDFKNNSDVWETILTLRADGDFNPSIFYDTLVRINQNQFYHDEFQFRFISFGRKSGRYDSWNLDYVYLNVRNSYDMNTSISDRAMTKPFTSVLGEYFSVPYNHFISDPAENFTKPYFELNNLKDTTFAQVVNYTSYFKITNYTSGTGTDSFNGVLDFEEGIGALPSLSRSTYQLKNLPAVSNFNPAADSASVSLKLGFNSGDNDYDYYSRYEPIEFRVNDTIMHTFKLSNYYAYDDGQAEYAAGLTTAGNYLAYQFIMKTHDKDTLSGVSFHFPYVAGSSPSSMDVYIFDNQQGKPGNILFEQNFEVVRTANNEFIHTKLFEGIIVQDTFYIGYREPVSGRVRIGLDKSYDATQRMYFKATEGGVWSNNWITGSMMIRPHFGKPEIVNAVREEVNPVVFYPNPNTGEFYMKGQADHLHVFNITGQPIDFRVEEWGDQKKISLSTASSGLYLVRYLSSGKFFTEKIIVR